MSIDTYQLPGAEFERLQRLVAVAVTPCSNGQIRELVDQLHGVIRRRHNDAIEFVEIDVEEARETRSAASGRASR
ncbi:MAG: hypothetical protein JWM33_2229 [Caulobacteraceae bacterium]|nr:hypothetical protein [Caulobacteraceae bacterium]